MMLVWVKGMRGPTPEKWGDDYTGTDCMGRPVPTLSKRKLNEWEHRLSLRMLSQMYPCESTPVEQAEKIKLNALRELTGGSR